MCVTHGIETATFHILTPDPGTALHTRMAASGRMLHDDLVGALRHAAYAAGWKKFEPLWDAAIRLRACRHDAAAPRVDPERFRHAELWGGRRAMATRLTH